MRKLYILLIFAGFTLYYSQDSVKFWKKARQENTYKGKEAEHYGTDNSGLYGSNTQSHKTYPDKYAEMAKAKGLSPYEIPQQYELEESTRNIKGKNI